MRYRSCEEFNRELEKFILTRLRPSQSFFQISDIEVFEKDIEMSASERLDFIDEFWGNYNYMVDKRLSYFNRLTNHIICHEMFRNAIEGRSRVFIQVPTRIFDKPADIKFQEESEGENNAVIVSCSLLTLQILDYDLMMFRAINSQNVEYSNSAKHHYRPYLFSFVAELDRQKYDKLLDLFEKAKNREYILPDSENDSFLWLECTFGTDIIEPHFDIDGYVIQSASRMEKYKAKLKIIENESVYYTIKKSILDYNLPDDHCICDSEFIDMLKSRLDCLSAIDVYKIGNGNCVLAKDTQGDSLFFFDIGFNYGHRPGIISPGTLYNYSDSMKEILANDPSFLILSHWDMDHIAGSYAAKKDILDKDWFAPCCFDACTNTKRLAKYLYLNGKLHCISRKAPGRQIGASIIIDKDPFKASYTLYMGAKAACDSSYANCEGIVMEYKNLQKNKTILMMGDVNYESYNKARLSVSNEACAEAIRRHCRFSD